MNKKLVFVFMPVILMLITATAMAATYYVPDDHTTIQAAVDNAADGDTILVRPGTYKAVAYPFGSDKSLTLRSTNGAESTIIDADGSIGINIGIAADNAITVIDGFTITNGHSSGTGGGIFCNGGSLTVTNCIFSGNSAEDSGGAIGYRSDGVVTITHCVFNDNYTSSSGDQVSGGGAIYISNSTAATIANCALNGNSSYGGTGGGIFNINASATITNCTISNASYASEWGGAIAITVSSTVTITNSSLINNNGEIGGGIYCKDSSVTVKNSILWNNTSSDVNSTEIYLNNGSIDITYSDIEGGYTGTGNIDADPMFVDAANGDLHLKPSSPCIDAGDNTAPDLPATDMDGEDRQIDDSAVADTGNGTPPIVDMGADEFLDTDQDGTPDYSDNCPGVDNPNQTDTDIDGVGDACDNCVSIANASQANSDSDCYGDACDNCPGVVNSDQKDEDGDGIGDVCDADYDVDSDGVAGDVDNCPLTYNPGQENSDGDAFGDACDACPKDADNDVDSDGICGNLDNCPLTANADQKDTDNDGIGDVCDSDYNVDSGSGGGGGGGCFIGTLKY